MKIAAALEKIQLMFHDKIVQGIEQEDGSGLCWNVKFYGKTTWTFVRVTPQDVEDCLVTQRPSDLQLYNINMFRQDVFNKLVDLLASVGLTQTTIMSGGTNGDLLTIYAGDFMFNIKF